MKPNYSPPPASLDHLNPIQRYMQKGSLDKEDYVWLLILVLAYVAARPYIQKMFKYAIGSEDIVEGEQAQKDYIESKAKVAPNAIRGSGDQGDHTVLETERNITASGIHTGEKGQVKNRKVKDQPLVNNPEEDKLLDWEDEPARESVVGDKSDVMAWLDKWDK